METSPLLSPLLLGPVPHYDLLRRYHSPLQPAEVNWVAPPPEPNFRIDDLLDFSNGELCEELSSAGGEEEAAADEEEEEGEKEGGIGGKELKYAGAGQEVSQTSGLCVPSDELADELEWLSAFNEDSSYSGDRQLASLVSSGSLGGLKDDEIPRPLHDNKFQTPSPISVLEPSGIFYANPFSFTASTSNTSSQHVPSRARSKRARTSTRTWSLDSRMPTLFDSRLGGAAAAQDSPVFFGSPPDTQERFGSSKKAKKPLPPLVEAPIRRCSHCLVQKTPQWRAGPMGPKTLCNACGVRYKSGRLVPEYRPASSPSFVNDMHSNSHKRILEMRRMKEMEEHSTMCKEEEEEGDSDCFSQTESCNEDPIDRRVRNGAWENTNRSVRSYKEDAMELICIENEHPAGSICSVKEDSIEPVLSEKSNQLNMGTFK